MSNLKSLMWGKSSRCRVLLLGAEYIVPFKSKEETKVKILRYARFYSLCRILRNLQPEERSICFRICSFSGCRPACLTTCQFTWLLSYVVGSAGSSKKKQR
ncbi:hypothetical protein V6N11_045930 [Hibiscus sabdariffa]|uniref:Uncharacterized protein n=2 Tax=Hibiscus sabdariffa TaxID=183260 RepID=A0ABR2Q329_9ROSI